MDFDYDESFREAVARGLESVLENLTPEQLAKVQEDGGDRLADAIGEAIPGVIEESAKGIVESLKQDAPGMLEHRRTSQADYEKRLADHWGAAFDLTEMVMKVASAVGEFFYEKHVPADGQREPVFEALTRLLARACRIAEEVLVLLKAGYGQGAMARWRALDEVATVADFIAENGDDCAQRYFAYEAVESWNAMKEYQRHAKQLGETPYSAADVEAMRRRVDELLVRYGRRFGESYGWAQAALEAKDPSFSTKRLTLSALRESVGTDHMAPYYRMASHGVHANPKGITWTPDALPTGDRETILTGPSPAGLADPGHCTLISLTRVTATTLASKRGEATAQLILVLLQLTDEAGDEYLRAHRDLQADERVRTANATGSSTAGAAGPFTSTGERRTAADCRDSDTR